MNINFFITRIVVLDKLFKTLIFLRTYLNVIKLGMKGIPNLVGNKEMSLDEFLII